MKTRFIYLGICLFFAAACPSIQANADVPPAAASPEKGTPVPLGDPFILPADGVYYAYGTHADDGIEVYRSDNLAEWEYLGLALRKDDVWADRWFWAPEVYEVKGKYYMYYSADEHICAAVADSPRGPFRQKEKKPMIADEKCIDNSLFIDDDGTPYLFFVRFNDGLNIWVAELEDDLLTLKKQTMRPCIHVSQPWEEVWPRVNEGPFVVKRNGVYYMTYSANSYESPFYGIGCATATQITGEWTKYETNPLLQKPGDLAGVGHSALFTDREGRLRIVYHAHKDTSHIHPRGMYIGEVRFDAANGADSLRIGNAYEIPVLKTALTPTRKK